MNQREVAVGRIWWALPCALLLVAACGQVSEETSAGSEPPAGEPEVAEAEDRGFECEIEREDFAPELESEWRDYTLNTLNQKRRPTLVEGLAKLTELRDPVGTLRAVDLGAGAGNDTRFLLAEGHRVHSVEPDPFAVAVIEECARQQGTAARLEVQEATFEAMELPEDTFDFANASLSLPFATPETFDRVWDEIAESLVVGGVFSGNFFGPEHEWAEDPGMTFLGEDEVRALFSRHPFEILELREENRETDLANGGMARFHTFSVIAVRRSQ
jgi:SAM-dependent methyltransferase